LEVLGFSLGWSCGSNSWLPSFLLSDALFLFLLRLFLLLDDPLLCNDILSILFRGSFEIGFEIHFLTILLSYLAVKVS
jgi:hypothetical protein